MKNQPGRLLASVGYALAFSVLLFIASSLVFGIIENQRWLSADVTQVDAEVMSISTTTYTRGTRGPSAYEIQYTVDAQTYLSTVSDVPGVNVQRIGDKVTILYDTSDFSRTMIYTDGWQVSLREGVWTAGLMLLIITGVVAVGAYRGYIGVRP